MLNTLYTNFFSNFGFDLLIVFTVGVSLFLLIMYMMPDEEQAAIKRRLGVVERSSVPENTPLLKQLHPFYNAVTPLLYVDSAPDFWLNYLQNKKKKIHKKLIAANLRKEISPDEFMGLKCVMSFLFLFLIWMIYGALAIEFSANLVPICMIIGYIFPDLWLSEKISLRRKAILSALPYSIDLLTLSVESGLDFISAISRLVQKSESNELHKELDTMLKEIRLGTVRSAALKKLSDRIQVEEVTSLTTLLIQTQQLGASVGQVLRAQSDQLRVKRFQAAEAAGARASQIILFPLVFCILPAAVFILLGPAALNFMSSGLL